MNGGLGLRVVEAFEKFGTVRWRLGDNSRWRKEPCMGKCE